MHTPTPASTLWPAGVALLGESGAEDVLHRWIAQEREALARQRNRWFLAFERALSATHHRASHDVRGAAGVVQAAVQLGGIGGSHADRLRRQVDRLAEVAHASDADVARAWAHWSEERRPQGAGVEVRIDEGDVGAAWPAVATCAAPSSAARHRATLCHVEVEVACEALGSLPRAVSTVHGGWAAWAAQRTYPGFRVAGRLSCPTASALPMAWACAAAEGAGEACVEEVEGSLAWWVPAARADIVAVAHHRGAQPGPSWIGEALPIVGGRLIFTAA